MLQTTKTDILAPFDCNTLQIWEVPLENGHVLKFHKPLVLQPEILDKNTPEECYCVEYPTLDISAFGQNRDELLSCIYGDVRFVWRHCLTEDTQFLSPQNANVKSKYLSACEEI